MPDAPRGRVLLLVTSPRLVPGLLSWSAWEQLRTAHVVLAADADPGWVDALAEAGVQLRDVAHLAVPERAARLVGEATSSGATAAWFSAPDGDADLPNALTDHLARCSDRGEALPEVEVFSGSYDLPGARLLDVVAVMDTLRSPGGCPWDAEQTHLSLAPYLLEEAHEAIEAMESGDRDHLREELGDVLLQVAFHARVAEEDGDDPFSIDDVAGALVAKLVHRHPHVFADTEVADSAEVLRNWETLKAVEKGERTLFEGIPTSLPALARAQKMLGRLRQAGLETAGLDGAVPEPADPLARQLWAAVAVAEATGQDAEATLRSVLAQLAERHVAG